jgi:hypothetical protein
MLSGEPTSLCEIGSQSKHPYPTNSLDFGITDDNTRSYSVTQVHQLPHSISLGENDSVLSDFCTQT